MEPEEADSKVAAIWKIQLAKLEKDGFALRYVDGSGRDTHHAAGTWSKERGSNGEYLGKISTPNDAETLATAIALEQPTQDDNITICADSRTALHTACKLSQGAPCCSTRIKNALQNL